MKKLTMLAAIAVLSACASVCAVAATGVAASEEVLREKAYEGRLSVRDFGARGDGVTDDTAAIQAGIDFLAKRGGGKLYFPYTTNGYLVASPGREFDAEGRLVRAQLVIPAGRHNIRLEGEMPCLLLYNYQVRQPEDLIGMTRFGENGCANTVLHSTWDAPEVTNANDRAWAVIAAPVGTSCAGKFSVKMFSFANLEIRVHLDKAKMYPTTSAANFHNIARLNVSDSQFCLDDAVGDAVLKKELQPSPCVTVGLEASGDQNDDQIFRNVAAQGFKYGFVFGEHTTAEHLYVHNTEYAISFGDSTHPSIINRVVAQHNQRIFCALPDRAFGRRAGWINLIVNETDYEVGHGTRPLVSRMRYGVWDPDSRFCGSIVYLQGYPGNGSCFFPVEGGKRLRCRALGAPDKAENH